MSENYDELSKQILNLDPLIRFVGVANIKGVLIAGGAKKDVEQILTGDQVSMSIHYAFQKRELYTNLAYKIGNERASITEFEKVTLISIPINSNEIVLTSTEPRADYKKIIDYVYSVIDTK